MKRLGLMVILTLLFIVSLNTLVQAKVPLAVNPNPTPSPVVSKIDYVLPYPGILPDHLLYSVKMLRDRIMDFLIKEPIKKTEFLILMADKRLGAGKTLVDYGKTNLGEETLSKGEKYLERAINTLAGAKQEGKNINGLLQKLEKAVQKHIEVLEEVLTKVPDEAKPGVKTALETAQKSNQRIIELKRGE